MLPSRLDLDFCSSNVLKDLTPFLTGVFLQSFFFSLRIFAYYIFSNHVLIKHNIGECSKRIANKKNNSESNHFAT